MRFLIFLLLIFSFSTFGSGPCRDLVSHNPQDLIQRNITQRARLVQKVKDANIPAFYRRVGEEKIPVIHLTKESYEHLSDEFESSVSQVLALTGAGNDHGMLLVRGREQTDRTFHNYGSGLRREEVKIGINDTGITSKDFRFTVSRTTRSMILFSYHLSDLEQRVVDYYTRVRKAGLFHVPSGWKTDEVIPNYFKRLCGITGELCHDYLSSTVKHGTQIQNMKYHLWELAGKVKDADQILASPAAIKIKTMAREELTSFSMESFYKTPGPKGSLTSQEEVINPTMFRKEEYLSIIDEIIPIGITADDKARIINMIVGIDALEHYKILSNRIGINKYDPWVNHATGNSRLTAIYVIHPENLASNYDGMIRSFFNATYENLHGANHHHLGDFRRLHSKIYD